RKIAVESVHDVSETAQIDLPVGKVDEIAICVDRIPIGEGTRIHPRELADDCGNDGVGAFRILVTIAFKNLAEDRPQVAEIVSNPLGINTDRMAEGGNQVLQGEFNNLTVVEDNWNHDGIAVMPPPDAMQYHQAGGQLVAGGHHDQPPTA